MPVVFEEEVVKKPRTLRGKYQLKKNIGVSCYLDVQGATDQGMQVHIGVKKRGDNRVAVGTRIFLNAESINKINARRTGTIDIFSTTVTDVQLFQGKYLHVCTPIKRETVTDRREEPRYDCDFHLSQSHSRVNYRILNGSPSGAKLIYQDKKAVMSLVLGSQTCFQTAYKDRLYQFNGLVHHILYDWRRHIHEVGIVWQGFTGETETIWNLLINPDYSVDLTGKHKVDGGEGKIRSH